MIDTNWSGKQLSSEKATGKVVHCMAQQTARAVPKAAHSGHARATRSQGFCWGRELRPWEELSGLSGTALPWPSPQLTVTLCQLHISPFLLQRQLNPSHATSSVPLHDDSLALLPGTVMRWKEEYLSLMASDQCLAGGCLNLAVVFSLASLLKD